MPPVIEAAKKGYIAYTCCTAALADQPPVYKFRDLPRTGSHLPRNVATSPLPFDKRYGDFTDIACALTGRVPDAVQPLSTPAP